MPIIELTERGQGRGLLYLNTDHIISVQRVSDDTWVTTTQVTEGTSRIHVVAESPEHVVDLIRHAE